MAVDPTTALAALKNLITQPKPPEDVYDPSGNVQLLDLQQQHADDMRKNLERQAMPSPGGAKFYAGATPADLSQEEGDIATNPVTEQGNFMDALGKANQQAQLAGFGGDPNSPVAQQAGAQRDAALQKLLLPEQVKGQYALAGDQVKANAALAVAQAKAGAGGGLGFKPSVQEQRTIDSIQSAHSIINPLMGEIEQSYPGIGADPSKYGSPLSDTLTQKFGKGLYSWGGVSANDPIYQKIAAARANIMSAFGQGRITAQIMNLLAQHLPDVGLSMGANYERMRNLESDIFPQQLNGIKQAHTAQGMELDPLAGLLGVQQQ